MNKRITSLMLVFVMVLAMLATAVPALAAPVGPNDAEYSVEADKTSAAPGEEIKFTVYIQQNGNLNVIEARLKIPTGLTYIPDSGALVENIQATLGWDATDWTPDPYMMVNGYGAESYTGTDKLALMTFKCTVDSDAPAGDYEVTLHEFLTGDDTYNEKPTTCIPATVTVTGATKPATGITLNKTALTLTAGKSDTLTATVTPADTTDTVSWSSSKEAVATVDSTGKVTAKAPGTATITATAGTKTATCTVTVEAAPCTHPNKTTVPAKASNCTDQGWDAYQTCDDCGALFNASGAPITKIPYKPLNNDHDFDMSAWGYKKADGHAHVCTRNPAHHDTVKAHTPGAPATETKPQTCTVCGYVITPATGHLCVDHLTKVEAKAATCTAEGNKEYYKCTCGKLYWDDDAFDEITGSDSAVIPALGHDWKDATCTDPKTCSRCGATDGAALGHSWKDATCTAPKTCDRCGATDGSALGHDYDMTQWGYKESDGHAHVCKRDPAHHDTAVAHTSSGPATSTTPETCTVCGYVIAPATGGGSTGGGDGGVITYAITASAGEGGKISPSGKVSAARNSNKTFTMTADEGYEIADVVVDGKSVGAVERYAFEQIRANHTIHVTFAQTIDEGETPLGPNPFTDVPEDSYYEDAVLWAVNKGITSGTSATTFAPDGICTRAQAVTFLWRAAGSPAPETSAMPFADVPGGSWYYDAVLWAVEQGITSGTSATTFAPDLNCTRAQIVTFLWRTAGSPAVSGSAAFDDVAADAYYAQAVKWAEADGITSGIGDGLFGSDNDCTRAQIVTFIYRYMEK